MSAYAKLKQVCHDRMITGEGIVLILSAYAECLKADEPHAAGEATTAGDIGLNIAEILSEVAE